MMQSQDDLLAAIRNLQARFDEVLARAEAAEDALRAIQNGEVDALVISGTEGDLVYTLEGADQTYRVMVESVQEGVANLQADGMVLYANQRLAEILGVSFGKLIGTALLPYVHVDDCQVFLGLLRKGTEGVSKGELRLLRQDGSTIPVLMSFTGVENQGNRVVTLVVTDLTEHQRREEILAAERLARSILEQASEAIVVCDNQGMIIRVSQAAYNLIPSNPLYQPFEKVFPLIFSNDGEHGKYFSLDTVFQGRVYRGSEVRLAQDDGSPDTSNQERYLLLGATPLHNDNEETIGCVLTLTDITKRKQAEKALAASEKRFRALIEMSPDGVVVVGKDGTVNFVSPSTTRILGYTPEDLLGKLPFDLVHPDEQMQTIALFTRFTGQPDQVNHAFQRMRHKDGSWRICEFTVSNLLDDPEIKGIVANYRDVTERKQAEAALQESEARFKLSLEHSPTMVYQTDEDLRYVWIYNPQHGLTDKEIVGKRDEELNPPETVAEIIAFKRTVLASGVGARAEVHFPIGGQDFLYDVTAEPIFGDDGQVIGLTVAATDITETAKIREKAQADAARLEVQRRLLEQREQERIQIARDLHDGPVQELTGATFNLRGMLMDGHSPELMEQLGAIQNVLQEQINELRAYASELRPPSLSKFGLVKAMRSYLDNFQEKHPELRIQFEGAQEGEIVGEEVRLALFRIYQESLANVVKHAGAAEVIIGFTKLADEFVLTIQDNGRGFVVPKDWVELARQGHLGLVGMRERAEAIGGKLEIHSQIGKGTHIQVKVPFEPSK